MSPSLDAFLWTELLDKFFIEMIEDEEFRVRNQSALLIKAIIRSDRTGKGIANFDKMKNLILANIQATFERDSSGDASGAL